ncbi:MAG: hypothetical protein IKE92_06790 [Clostridiales bacterium]|nr:hypothetical protein [Clostridiales bacterium]
MKSGQKFFRKLLVVLLSAVLITIMCPICVMAAGNTYQTASSISFNTKYNGSITDSNEVDYYRIDLANSGTLTIKAQAEMYRVQYTLLYGEDASGQIFDYKPNWDPVSEMSSNTYTCYLNSGTYYFRVHKFNYYSSENNNGKYNFTVSFTNANESFKEPVDGSNNTLNKANSINLNTTYTGLIAMNDSKDFYKFTVPADDKVSINLVAYTEYINMYLYDSEGVMIDSKLSIKWEEVSELSNNTYTYDLTKGTYYLALSQGDYYNSPRYGTYKFTVKANSVKPLSITTQPKDYTGAVGSTASFSVAAQGTGLSYQWQSYSNGSWNNSNATGAKTSKISFKVTNNHNGMKYRCLVKDSNGQKVYSNTATVHVSSSVTITKQPANVTGSVGDTASFSVTAQGSGLQYQWQMYSNGAWKNSGATGAKTNKITFKIGQSHNGMKYRCIITTSNGQKFYSNTATVKVVPALTITKQPASISCYAGNTVSFSVTAKGDGLTYQWQMYSNGAWKNSGATGATTSKISFKATKNHNGMKYRCVVKDKYGKKLLSNTATITVR